MRALIYGFCFLFPSLMTVAAVSTAAENKPDEATSAAAPAPRLTAEAQAIADRLDKTLPADSEARAMYAEILKGSQLGPGEGWFRMAVTQSRYGWAAVARKYAGDDEKVARVEFPGSDADFKRLDRDADDTLTAADFDYSASATARTPGMMLFLQADRDGNGKVTAEEFTKVFQSLDGDGDGAGFLALDDLRDRFAPPDETAQRKMRDRPSEETLLKGLEQQEIGSLQPGPALEQPAPDFGLPTPDESRTVRLSSLVGQKPVVLIFGNFTCGPFRGQSGNIEKLYHRYRDRAEFLMVYVREAHPQDGWAMESNQRVGIELAQPKTDAERRQAALRCRGYLALDLPMVVDTVDDRVGAAYSGMPNRLYLIDQEGRVAFKSGRGPFGFKPVELEQALVLLLNEPASGTPARAETAAR